MYLLYFFLLQGRGVATVIAEKLNEKLNYTPEDKPPVEDESQFRVFEEELEINDFPQNVRYRVCSKVGVAGF
jgi:ATP-dependent RNA helicase DDX46/PRP5